MEQPKLWKREEADLPCPSETQINDLPDECLAAIFRLVCCNTPPLVQRITPFLVEPPIIHPRITLSCASVCKRWHAAAVASVQSLSLSFCDAVCPSTGHADDAVATAATRYELLAPHLTSLHLLRQDCPWVVTSSLRILPLCRSLQNLRVDFDYCNNFTEAETQTWMETVGGLPSLKQLRLAIGGLHFKTVCAWLDAMMELQDLHLECRTIPPASVGRLLSILRSLDLMQARAVTLPPIRHLTALEVLCLRKSHWGSLPSSLGRLSHLTRLEFDEMSSMPSLPSAVGELRNLEVLRVIDSDIAEFPPESLSGLLRLTHLELQHLDSFSSLPDTAIRRLSSLRTLIIKGCPEFETLPETIGSLQQLQTLRVSRCLALPQNLTKLTNFEALCCGGKMTALPDGMSRLLRLKSLRLLSCSRLEQLPECLGDLTALEELEVQGCPLERLPESIGCLTGLKICKLVVIGTDKLPESLGSLIALEELELRTEIDALPDIFGQLSHLKVCKLDVCLMEALPESIGCCQSLETLVVRCPPFFHFPRSICRLSRLKDFSLICRYSMLDEPATCLRLWRCDNALRDLAVGGVRANYVEMLSVIFSGGLEEMSWKNEELAQLIHLYLQRCDSDPEELELEGPVLGGVDFPWASLPLLSEESTRVQADIMFDEFDPFEFRWVNAEEESDYD